MISFINLFYLKFFMSDVNLIKRIEEISSEAFDNGWKLTKKATASKITKTMLSDEAESAYMALSHRLTEFLSANPSEEISKFLDVKLLEADINVFDLYRRVGRLEEARMLGEKTFDKVKEIENIPLINRCANLLSIVGSSEAYHQIGESNFERAYENFSKVEEIFKSMNVEESETKDALMIYSNRSANLLDMVNLSVNEDIHSDERDENLESAERYNVDSFKYLDNPNIKEEDKLIWTANFHYNSGLIHQHRGDIGLAIEEYRKAIKFSNEDSNYNLQTMILYTKLSDALISTKNPDFMEEVRDNYKHIEEFLENGDFGIFKPIIDPMIDRIRDNL